MQLTLPAATQAGAAIPDGGTLPIAETVSEVDLDQLFNTLDPKTIGRLQGRDQGLRPLL